MKLYFTFFNNSKTTQTCVSPFYLSIENQEYFTDGKITVEILSERIGGKERGMLDGKRRKERE